MDIDEIRDDNHNDGTKVWTHPVLRVPPDFYPLKRRLQEPNTAKVRLVTGPQREEYDNARDMEAFHKDQVLLAKQKNNKLALANQQLQAELAAAERMKAEHITSLNFLHQELASKTQAIAEMQQHEGQLEAQFLGTRISSKRCAMKKSNGSTVFWSVQKKDEAIQLRAYNHLQSMKAPQKPPPRRGTRASLDPVRNSSTRTIQIPLDPIPTSRAARGESNSTHKAQFTANPALANLLGTNVNTLSTLMGKLERLLINDNVTVNVEKATPKKRNNKKPQRPGKALMNHIHYEPEQTDEAKVAACEAGRSDPPDNLFQWYFGPGYNQARWNDLMIVKVVDAALEADGEEGAIAKAGVERDLLEALMAEKMARYRAAWKGFQPRFNDSLGRMETTPEARARGTEAFEQHQLETRTNSSKHRKFEDRFQTVTATIRMKRDEGIAGDIETWVRLLELLEHLGEQGMSSEEEDEVEVDDAKVVIYKVKLCIWREPELVKYFRFVDAQTALFKKHQRGPTPASRIRSGAPGSAKAPRGLPKSLYNPEWLKKLTPACRKELKVSKEAFELFVAATERMVV
ncbi:hypothetical protein B0H19DRAFT_1083010 [Mycena capillaripes]|nr:hypothetical protein B0H19DRAFT_1083010 [Mycena capillaripes]